VTGTQQFRDRIGQVDGGELVDVRSASPYSIVFPPSRCNAVIYTTKIHAASQLLVSQDGEIPVGLIGRYGLPRDEDILAIAHIVRNHAVYFLGDCELSDG
jgi:hypothetical protein